MGTYRGGRYRGRARRWLDMYAWPLVLAAMTLTGLALTCLGYTMWF